MKKVAGAKATISFDVRQGVGSVSCDADWLLRFHHVGGSLKVIVKRVVPHGLQHFIKDDRRWECLLSTMHMTKVYPLRLELAWQVLLIGLAFRGGVPGFLQRLAFSCQAVDSFD
jgi:hypothetical protein